MHRHLKHLCAALLAAAVVSLPTLASAETPHASCKQRAKLRSPNSTQATAVTFVNASGMSRGILWIGFDGHPKDYASLNPGERTTIKSFVGHPWMITTGPGDCLEIVVATPGNPTFMLVANPGAARGAPAPAAARGGEEGTTLKGCPVGTVPVDQTDDCKKAPPGQATKGNPVSGRSLGGIVRSGPNQASARVTSLKENDRITILQNTGIVTDGYAWFRIQAGSVSGYQWGGILCSDVPIPDAFECKR